MRKKIPSTAALLAFESAARHESFTRAAEELALTQSAICRQIGALEDFLGVPLFAAHAAEPETRFGPSEVEAELKALDLDGMSPREAMAALYRLKDKLT